MARWYRHLWTLSFVAALAFAGCSGQQDTAPADSGGNESAETAQSGHGHGGPAGGHHAEGGSAESSPADEPSADPKQEKDAAAGEPAPQEGQETSGSAASSGTAKAAVENVIAGLQENRADVLWESLPASYQQDVNDVVHLFAEKMDPEVWDRLFTVLQKGVKVLETKRDIIFELAEKPEQQNQGQPQSQPSNQPPGGLPSGPGQNLSGPPAAAMMQQLDPETKKAMYDAFVGMLKSLVNSDLSDLEKLKTADVGDFLQTTGGEFVTQLAKLFELSPKPASQPQSLREGLAQMKVEVVSEGDPTTLKITSPGNAGQPQTKEVKFTQVEGKWIPEDLAAGWDSSIQQAKAALQSVTPEKMAQGKQQALAGLDRAEQFLDQLQATESPEQFQQVVMQAVAPLMGMMMGGMAGGPGGPGGLGGQAGPGGGPSLNIPDPGQSKVPNDAVAVVIQGKLEQDRAKELSEKLRDLSDKPNQSFAVYTETGQGVRFQVSPVKDVQAFAQKIDFGKTQIDAGKRTITVELKASGDSGSTGSGDAKKSSEK